MRSSTRYVHLAAVQIAAIVVTVGVCIFTATGQVADQAAMVTTTSSTAPALLAAQRISSNYVVLGAGLLMLASMAVALLRRRIADAAAAVIVFGGSTIAAQLLKHEVISRPELTDWGAYGNSLPSGHATIAIAAACAAMFAAPVRAKYILAPVLAIWAAVAGTGVIAAGWHRPSDVVTASLIVGFWCSIAALVISASRRRSAVASASRTTPSRRWSRVLAPVLVFGASSTALALCIAYATGNGRALAAVALTVVAVGLTVGGALASSVAVSADAPRRQVALAS